MAVVGIPVNMTSCCYALLAIQRDKNAMCIITAVFTGIQNIHAKGGRRKKNGFNRVILKEIKVLRLKTQIQKQAGSVFVCA